MISQTDLAWLSGIVDGEGSITFHRNRSGKFRPTPLVYIVNTSDVMISKIVIIFKELKVDYYYLLRNINHSKWKPCHSIRISKINSLKILLNAILPYLVSKQKQAELVLGSLQTFPHNSVAINRLKYAEQVWGLNCIDNSKAKPSEN
jgi:hypothetical protein